MEIRNLAIIAHVDHGKTTLVDALLKQGGAYAAHEEIQELAMDSNDQERERGITIYAKNTSIRHKGGKINIVDTPGHADFGSEVERILRTVDCVLLLVDAQEGPMPQTKFVLKKSLELGLKPIVVINKIDKPAARPTEVIDEVFDLFVALGAKNDQLDFPIIYANAREGVAKHALKDESSDLTPLFETIEKHVPPAPQRLDVPFRMQPCTLDYDNYIGRMGIGRVYEGKAATGSPVTIKSPDGTARTGRITKILVAEGLRRVEIPEAIAGDMVILSGIPDIDVGETITTDPDADPLPAIAIDPPTVSMTFGVNTSPFAGNEGTFSTARHVKERLEKELLNDVALRVEKGEGDSRFVVSGRGELHLAILIEKMRREGFELEVSRPQVIFKETDGKVQEPFEAVSIECPEANTGAVIEKMGRRRGEMKDMRVENGIGYLEFEIPTRGLIGYRTDFMADTKGQGIINSLFLGYRDNVGDISANEHGSMISMENGTTMHFALANLQERGSLFVGPGVEVYAGMVIGQYSRVEDIEVNPCKEKKLLQYFQIIQLSSFVCSNFSNYCITYQHCIQIRLHI